MFRKFLLAGTAFFVGASLCSSAVAQQGENEDGESEARRLDAVTVTAQKREESLQDVPVTVSVVTGDQLAAQAISNLTDLQNATAELNFTGNPSAGYSIRGSGTQTFTRSAENNVLVVVDGVVQGQLTPPTTSLFDVAQVEVLSGPQGMLFGKNASAGVVNITTVAPRIGEFGGRLSASAGEDDFLVVQGVLNIPLGDTAALRLNASQDEIGNRFQNLLTDDGIGKRTNTAYRGRLLIEPNEDVTLNIIADYELGRGGNAAWTSRSLNPGGTLNALQSACGITPGDENLDLCVDGPLSRRLESQGVSAQVDWVIGDHTFTSVTGYRSFERETDTDSDALQIDLLNLNSATDDVEQFSQEFRIASPDDGALDYLVGLFYYDYSYLAGVDQGGTLGFLPFVAARSSEGDVGQESFAVFGQAGYQLNEKWRLIAGGRFTQDTVQLTRREFTDPELGVFIPGFGFSERTFEAERDEDNFSWRLGVQHFPNPDLTLFATVSQGYKGPALNNGTPGSLAPLVVEPEIPTNIELGAKGTFFNGRARGDLTFFHTNVEDFQAQTVVEQGGLTEFVFTNAEELTFTGVQASADLIITDELSANFSVLYNQAEYGEFFVACNDPFLTGCQSTGAGNIINVEGRQLAGAPEWKLTYGVDYERPVLDGFLLYGNLNAVYRSDTNTSATPDPNLVIDAYTLVDARFGVRQAQAGWSISVFARNLFDERAPTLIFRDPLQSTLNYQQSFGSSAFRTVGVTLDVEF